MPVTTADQLIIKNGKIKIPTFWSVRFLFLNNQKKTTAIIEMNVKI